MLSVARGLFLSQGSSIERTIKFSLRKIAFQIYSAIVSSQLLSFSCTDSEILPDVIKEKIIMKLRKWEVNYIIKQDCIYGGTENFNCGQLNKITNVSGLGSMQPSACTQD